MQSERREFPNKFGEYNGEQLVKSDGKLEDKFASKLKQNIDLLLRKLYSGLEDEDDSNYSVYTGFSGIALLHYHMYNKLDGGTNKGYLEQAISYIKRPLRHLKGRKFTFMCGDAGPLALGAVLYNKLGKPSESKDCIKRLEAMHHTVCGDPSIPDEHLYGRVGYLFGLMFVQNNIGMESVDKVIVTKVCKTIIESGQSLAQHEKWKHPLMYQWHEKHYLGAAHGLAGIFYLLMQVQDLALKPQMNDLVKPSIDFMLSLQFPSGNCPSSIGSSTGDKLVHWCHGAPGWIYMFISAYKNFSDPKYLEAAKKCADVIWERGLLRKGYGICHGTAGNAYAFLAMYNLTQEQTYLYKAYKFAEWCCDYGKHGCRIPDTPYSLFEGMAGTIYFLVDLLDPKNAKFPAYEL